MFVLAASADADAAEFTWAGSDEGADNKWTTPGNWQPSTGFPSANDGATIRSATAPSAISLTGRTKLRALTFDPGALHSCEIAGGSFLFGDGATITFKKLPGDVGTGKSASQTIASSLSLSGTVHFANLNRHYLGGEKLHLTGAVSGDGTFVVAGVRHGILQLGGDNSKYRGSFVINTGSLMLGHSAALGSGRAPVTLNGGAIVIGARVSTTHDLVVTADADWDAHGPNGNHDGTITIRDGATLAVKNGGGNTTTWRGAITGQGDLRFAAHGTTFAGSKANTLTGTTIVGGTRGSTILARPPGTDVIAGPLVMADSGTLRWQSDEQLADTTAITFAGDFPKLDLHGHHETAGVLDLQGDARIELGDGGSIKFAESSGIAWKLGSILLISGPGRVHVGVDANSLTETQIAQIGFVDPPGMKAGTHTARLHTDGSLQPSGQLVVPRDLPVDQSPEHQAKRRALYNIDGLERLTGHATPLTKPGTVISVFGDSITWGGGYLRIVRSALDTGAGTRALGVKLINHGVNGGGVLAIRDGDTNLSHFGNTKPKPFAETIAVDKTDVAVIFIGVNDVWWRKTPPETFERALRDLVAQAEANGTKPVLATLAILKEVVGGRNPACDTFADLTRKVARDTGATLVDLRAAFMACMENESIEVRPGGSWTSNGKLLTHDGVHTNARGDQIISDHIAEGIVRAFNPKKE